MPFDRRSSWDSPFPESVPLPVTGGVATSKQRGAMASTWWSRRFTALLESYGLGGRMQRGRRYARTGQVLHIDVDAGVIAAQVQGSRARPYLVTIAAKEPTARQWEAIELAMTATVGFVARLLAGELPPDLEGVFEQAGTPLFPATWADLRAKCSCPDWENPCKHIAAVLYVFADQLDIDPWLLLAWRGRTQDEITTAFAQSSTGVADKQAPAIWWPFPPGRIGTPRPQAPGATPGSEPGEVLDRLDPLAITVRGGPVTDLLLAAYRSIATAVPDDPAH
jgi:uncharacterized Zn finger protein